MFQKYYKILQTFISQNEVNMANERLKVQQPLLGSSSEMDKLRCITIRRNLQSPKLP